MFHNSFFELLFFIVLRATSRGCYIVTECYLSVAHLSASSFRHSSQRQYPHKPQKDDADLAVGEDLEGVKGLFQPRVGRAQITGDVLLVLKCRPRVGDDADLKAIIVVASYVFQSVLLAVSSASKLEVSLSAG